MEEIMNSFWGFILLIVIVLGYGLFGKIEGQYGGFKKPFWRNNKQMKKSKKKKR
jgi:hypothetical protein